MLTGLSIRDFVLIAQLELVPQAGLTVLTGETGAGKSILLDALGAACGARSEAGLVRQGAEKASVTATFSLDKTHPALALLRANELDSDDGELRLRRVIQADGKSKAFINDQPVGITLLRQIGSLLVEVHGQFDTHGLLDPTTHREALDRFAEVKLDRLKAAYIQWQQAAKSEAAARDDLARARQEEEFLRADLDELAKLAPVAGEEEKLIAQKQLLQNKGKLADGVSSAHAALADEQGAESALINAARALNKLEAPQIPAIIAQLDIARDAVAEAQGLLEQMQDDMQGSGLTLDQVEDRLYALRAAARRHHITIAELPALAEKLDAQLNLLDHSEEALHRLAEATLQAKASYTHEARLASELRQKAAKKLDKAMKTELTPLRLERAVFTTAVTEGEWSASGWDEVSFTVATNPGASAGPLNKIASGGELARFMLALKVTLAGSSDAVALIFDEIDQGVGGAVAAAVGERLAKLAASTPVLVVTHSPQVAAKAATHWRVEKSITNKVTRTHVAVLDDAARREELARMLAGEKVTEASRQAAAALLEGTAA